MESMYMEVRARAAQRANIMLLLRFRNQLLYNYCDVVYIQYIKKLQNITRSSSNRQRRI